MQLNFFHLNLILHACAAHIRCENYGISNFASKPGQNLQQLRGSYNASSNQVSAQNWVGAINVVVIDILE